MSARSIWKFPLQLEHEQTVTMPKGARILSVQLQGGNLCLWALVNPGADQESVRVLIVGTGWGIDDAPIPPYVGTVQLDGLVWHVFVGGGAS